MCYKPLYISNKSAYINVEHSFYGYDVPCGHCLDCIQMNRDEWQLRVSFELKDLYANGGCAVFLTFTYDNAYLPHYRVRIPSSLTTVLPKDLFGFDVDIIPSTYRGLDKFVSVPCFNHDHVLGFLNNLKVNMHNKYGASSYKYFFTCEFGSDTHRPHYHSMFFLPSYVDVTFFCELCRSLWSYGFMFPRYDAKRKVYVDNDNQPTTPKIRVLRGCARYVSKYITKDLSYLNMPLLQEYLSVKSNKLAMKRFLPKHWQSNGLGFSIFSCIDTTNETTVVNLIRNGIMNPLTMKMCSLPRYVINKLMYYNVKSTRISSKTGKPLYDRELTLFGRYYMYEVYRSKIDKTCNKMMKVFQAHKSECAKLLPSFSSLFPSLLRPSDFRDYAIYRLVWRQAPYQSFEKHLSAYLGDISCLFELSNSYSVWINNKDTYFLKHHVSPKFHLSKRKLDCYVADSALPGSLPVTPLLKMRQFFEPYEDVVSLYEYFSFIDSRELAFKRQKKLDDYYKYRRKYCHKYPINQC